MGVGLGEPGLRHPWSTPATPPRGLRSSWEGGGAFSLSDFSGAWLPLAPAAPLHQPAPKLAASLRASGSQGRLGRE